ncbi:S-layer protein [Candidatus Nanohaloarchaea archaeon]|nr:S-layer protein [Candidatus Nanohaloarchaea archaeon]
MKKIKKLKSYGKAVAGSALLVGATLTGAAAVSAQTSDNGSGYTLGDYPQPFVNDNGVLDASIVVGSDGKQADVVSAIDIAGSLGNSAFSSETVEGTAGAVNGEQTETDIRSSIDVSIDASDYTGFVRKTVEDDDGNDVFVTESADFNVDSQVNETEAQVHFSSGDITYSVKYSPGFSVNDTITLLGEEYELTSVESGQVELGSSMTQSVEVGDSFTHGPYTVEVTGKTTSDPAEVAVRISKEEEVLDTKALAEGEELTVGNDDQFTVSAESVIFYADNRTDITLESTYTDTTLESGEEFPMDDRYKVSGLGISTTGTNSLQSITLANKVKTVEDPEDEDEVAPLEAGESFEGPDSYFTVTNQGLQNKATNTIEFGQDYEVTYTDKNHFEHSLDISKVTASGSAQLFAFDDGSTSTPTMFVDDGGSNSGTYEDGDDILSITRKRDSSNQADLGGKTAQDFTKTRYVDVASSPSFDDTDAVIRDPNGDDSTLESSDVVELTGDAGITDFASSVKFMDDSGNSNGYEDGEVVISSSGDSVIEAASDVITSGTPDFQAAGGTNIGFIDEVDGGTAGDFDSDNNEFIYDRGDDTAATVETDDTRLQQVTVIATSDSSQGNIELNLPTAELIGTGAANNDDGETVKTFSTTNTGFNNPGQFALKDDTTNTDGWDPADNDDIWYDVDGSGAVSAGDVLIYDSGGDVSGVNEGEQAESGDGAIGVTLDPSGSTGFNPVIGFDNQKGDGDNAYDGDNGDNVVIDPAGGGTTTGTEVLIAGPSVSGPSTGDVTTFNTATNAEVRFWDADNSGGMSSAPLKDGVYIEMPSVDGTLARGTGDNAAGDVRLTGWTATESAGTVSSDDEDHGADGLTNFASGDNVNVLDSNHDSNYMPGSTASGREAIVRTSDGSLDTGDTVILSGLADITGFPTTTRFVNADNANGYDDGEAIIRDSSNNGLSQTGVLDGTNDDKVLTSGVAGLNTISAPAKSQGSSGFVFVDDAGTVSGEFDHGDDVLEVTRTTDSEVTLDGSILNNFASDIKHTTSGIYTDGDAIVRDVDGNDVFSSSTDVVITNTVSGGNGAGIVENGQGDKEVYTDINGYPLKVEFDDSSDEATLSYQQFEETITVGNSNVWTTGYGFTVDADFSSNVGANSGEDLVLASTDSELNTEYGAKIRWTGSSTVVEEENGATATVDYNSGNLNQVTFSGAAPTLSDTEDGDSTLTNWGSAVELSSDSSASMVYPDERRQQLTAFGSVGEGSSDGEVMSPTGWPADSAKLDTEASKDQNLVLVGGPLVNDLTKDLAEAGKTWNSTQYENNKDVGVLDLVNDAFNNHHALVVAGWNAEDTSAAADYLASYGEQDTALEGKTTAQVNTNTGELVQ